MALSPSQRRERRLDMAQTEMEGAPLHRGDRVLLAGSADGEEWTVIAYDPWREVAMVYRDGEQRLRAADGLQIVRGQ